MPGVSICSRGGEKCVVATEECQQGQILIRETPAPTVQFESEGMPTLVWGLTGNFCLHAASPDATKRPKWVAAYKQLLQLRSTPQVVVNTWDADDVRALKVISMSTGASIATVYDVHCRLATNILCVTDVDRTGMGLFPALSRVNHSCVPNATYHWARGKMHLVALRTISTGEEVCAAYTEITAPADISAAEKQTVQRRVIFHQFGFWCTCSACGASK